MMHAFCSVELRKQRNSSDRAMLKYCRFRTAAKRIEGSVVNVHACSGSTKLKYFQN